MKQFSLPLPATAPEDIPILAAGHHNAHLRQMSSLERLSSRLVALTQSSSSSGMELRSSSSSPFVDSDEDEAALELVVVVVVVVRGNDGRGVAV
jgi:phosphatidate phosphatase LPIN